jgi:hypothetical protein
MSSGVHVPKKISFLRDIPRTGYHYLHAIHPGKNTIKELKKITIFHIALYGL